MPTRKTTLKTSPAKTKRSAPSKSTTSPEKNLLADSVFNQDGKPNNPFGQIKNPKVFIPVILILVAIFLYFAKGWFLVAMVNGHPISRVSLDRELEARYGKQVLTSLVTKELIEEEATKKHVTVSQQELQTAVKQISDQVAQQGQSLDQVLASRDMTRSDFEDQVKLQKLVEKLLADQIKVSDQEVQDYIDKNKDSLPQGQTDDQIKLEVRQQLEQQKLSDKAQAWISDLQKKASIQYFSNL